MIAHQYFSTVPSIRYIFKAGTVAHFVAGKYRTTKASEIEELDAEIEVGNQYIYIKQGEREVDTANDDPLAGLKRKAVEDYIKEQALLSANALNKEFGSTSKDLDIGAANSGNSFNAKDSVSGSSIPTIKVGKK